MQSRDHAGARRRRPSPKVLVAASLILVFAAAILALGAISHGKAPKLVGVAEVRTLLDGIPQHGNALGLRTAPVTLVEYVDLQCPYCREFEMQALPTLVERFVRTGKLRVELRPLAFIGADSVRGRNAIVAAGMQNRLFDLALLLYENQQVENTGWLDDRLVKEAAAAIPGLDVSRLLADRNTAVVATACGTFDAEADAAKITSTPTILVGRTGAALRRVTLASPTDEQTVAEAVAAAL